MGRTILIVLDSMFDRSPSSEGESGPASQEGGASTTSGGGARPTIRIRESSHPGDSGTIRGTGIKLEKGGNPGDLSKSEPTTASWPKTIEERVVVWVHRGVLPAGKASHP